jgi:CDP-diacylglycerol pyrophosphatase
MQVYPLSIYNSSIWSSVMSLSVQSVAAVTRHLVHISLSFEQPQPNAKHSRHSSSRTPFPHSLPGRLFGRSNCRCCLCSISHVFLPRARQPGAFLVTYLS